MNGLICTYSFSELEEKEGNKVRTPKENVPGIIRSEAMMKRGDKGDYLIVLVEDQETGQFREVFANTIKTIRVK